MHAERRKSQADRAIGALAERQHGVVSRAQLLELGLKRGAITHRIDLGRLRPVDRGVYRIGLLTTDGRRMAAVLACGPGAVLSHLSAAALWGIRQSGRIEVTTPASHRGPRCVTVHRSPLRDDERTTHRGIPTTTVPRTLLDLSAAVCPDDLRSALRQAEQLRLTDPLSLIDLAERSRGAPAWRRSARCSGRHRSGRESSAASSRSASRHSSSTPVLHCPGRTSASRATRPTASGPSSA